MLQSRGRLWLLHDVLQLHGTLLISIAAPHHTLHPVTQWHLLVYWFLLLILTSAIFSCVFTLLYALPATQSTHEKAVCPSVRPSVSNAWIVTKWKKDLPRFYTMPKIIYPSFLRRTVVGGGDASMWNFGSSWPCWSQIPDFQSIFARCQHRVLPQVPQEGSKMQNCRFPCKITLTGRLNKVCYKVSLCEKCQ